MRHVLEEGSQTRESWIFVELSGYLLGYFSKGTLCEAFVIHFFLPDWSITNFYETFGIMNDKSQLC